MIITNLFQKIDFHKLDNLLLKEFNSSERVSFKYLKHRGLVT